MLESNKLYTQNISLRKETTNMKFRKKLKYYWLKTIKSINLANTFLSNAVALNEQKNNFENWYSPRIISNLQFFNAFYPYLHVDFTLSELNLALKSLKNNNKKLGTDRIVYE